MPSTAGLLSSDAVSRRGGHFRGASECPDPLTKIGFIERREFFGAVGQHERPSFTGQIWPVIKGCQWQSRQAVG
jgi:hypothetical protein